MATALAGLVFALGPGHNTIFATLIPGEAGLALKMLVLMSIIIFTAAVILVYSHQILSKCTQGKNLKSNINHLKAYSYD